MPDPLPAGVTVERDGPLIRMVGLDRGGFITYRDLGGLDGAALDALIARQRDHFDDRGMEVEWKLHGHDCPPTSPSGWSRTASLPQERETVVVGPIAPLAAALPVPPEGVRLREVTARADLDRIAAMEAAVWDEPRGWLADGLEKEIGADPRRSPSWSPRPATRWSAPAGSATCAGTAFATLWGGSTLPRGAAGASTARWSATGPGSPTPAATR